MTEVLLSLVAGAAILWWILIPPSQVRNVVALSTPTEVTIRITVDLMEFHRVMAAIELTMAEVSESVRAFSEAWARTMEVIDAPNFTD